MSATLEDHERTNDRPRITREQAADEILRRLTDEPQSAASLRRQILGSNAKQGGTAGDLVRDGLNVLEAQRKATRVPSKGWKLYDASVEQPAAKQEITFDESWAFVKVGDMFVDESYQRPITNFVQRIESRFDPLLFQLLALSDRGARYKPHRYAIIDGQTRWVAATRLGIKEVPCVIYTDLTPEKEAEIFARLQKERRGMATWHRFRAALAAKDEEALAIKTLVEATGYQIGDQVGQIKAIAALESTYRRDEYLLARTLANLHAAWPEVVPEDVHIRGLHRFFRQYPLDSKRRYTKQNRPQVDDEKLATRLKTAGPEALKRTMNAVKEGGTVKGGNDLMMAHAIQKAYRSGR